MDLPGMCGLEGTHTCQIGVEIDHESAMMEGNIRVVELEWFAGKPSGWYVATGIS
jgi:hypothetical protein